MKRLLVYYSLSGVTRTVAKALASDLTTEIEELRCSRYSLSGWGFLRAAYDSWKGNPLAGNFSKPNREWEGRSRA